MIVAGHYRSGFKSDVLHGRGWRSLRGLGQVEGAACGISPPCNPGRPCSMAITAGTIQGGQCVPLTVNISSQPVQQQPTCPSGTVWNKAAGACVAGSSVAQGLLSIPPPPPTRAVQAVPTATTYPIDFGVTTWPPTTGTTGTQATTTTWNWSNVVELRPWLIGAGVVLMILLIVRR